MKIVGTHMMREMERRTIEEFNINSNQLMDRAGYNVAATVRRLLESAGLSSALALVIAGRGNNGGDAFVAARYLKDMGTPVEVWIAGSANQLSGDAALYYGKLKAAKIHVEEFPTQKDWDDVIANPLPCEALVDGVLGTGITGPARGPAAGAIRYIRSQANDALVISIDVPSGLNADTGFAEGDAVKADMTVTMGLAKPGLIEPHAADYVGAIEVANIGLPDAVIAEAEADSRELIFYSDLKPLFPRRKRNSHKGDYGHLLVVAGSRGMSGAAGFAVLAATRSGVGLVSAVVPQSIHALVANAALEPMVHPAQETEAGSLSLGALPLIRSFYDRVNAILIGPGLSRNPEITQLVRALLAETALPMVLDADALYALGADLAAIAKARSSGIIITPHPGEMARLLNTTVEYAQSDRFATAARAAKTAKAVVVLKGAGTVVAAEKLPLLINSTGNPGMANGGNGDVLAGFMAGFLAQGFSGYDAARAAVYLHGKAGDLVAMRHSQFAMNATDVLEELPFAFRDFTLR